MAEMSPIMAQLLGLKAEQERNKNLYDKYGLRPPEVYDELAKREGADKDLVRLRDTARAMQAGPIIAGASEASRALGGGGLNLNPALAWASGLPGAPKNLGAIAQANPYQSPSETIGNLMGMGNAVSSANARYLDARNKFRAEQGVGGTGKMDPLMAMLMRDQIRDENEKESRRYKEGQDEKDQKRKDAEDEKDQKRKDDETKNRLTREEQNYIRDMDQKDLDAALAQYTKWTSQYGTTLVPTMARASVAASNMGKVYKVDPAKLYYEIGDFKISKRVIPDPLRNKESQQFYQNLDSFILPLIRIEIGSQQTRNELEKQNKALAANKLGNFNQLISALNDRIDDITSAYEATLGPMKSTKGQAAYLMWKENTDDYVSTLRSAKMPLLKDKAPSSGSSGLLKSIVEGASDAADKFNEAKEVRDYADKHFGGDYSKSLNFLREKRGYKGN